MGDGRIGCAYKVMTHRIKEKSLGEKGRKWREGGLNPRMRCHIRSLGEALRLGDPRFLTTIFSLWARSHLGRVSRQHARHRTFCFIQAPNHARPAP